jgi:hypothetical protein
MYNALYITFYVASEDFSFPVHNIDHLLSEFLTLLQRSFFCPVR